MMKVEWNFKKSQLHWTKYKTKEKLLIGTQGTYHINKKETSII